MAFDLASDMDTAFLESGFEESVSYIVSGTIPVTHNISAIIFRGQEAKISLLAKNTSGELARKYDIEIYISRTDIPAIQVNADTVQLKKIPSDATNATMRVAGIIRMDEGAFRLGLA